MRYETESAAREAGEETRSRLKGDGWELRVWENLGWHYSVVRWPVVVTESTFRDGPQKFSASMTDDPDNVYIVGTPPYLSTRSAYFADPNEAVEFQLKHARGFAEKVLRAVERGEEGAGIDVATRTAEKVRQDVPSLGRVLDKVGARVEEMQRDSDLCDKPDVDDCLAYHDGVCNIVPGFRRPCEATDEDYNNPPDGFVNVGNLSAAAFQIAREFMGERLDSDEGLRIGYVSNIAMLLHDELGGLDKDKRDAVAEKLIKLIFGGER